MIYQLMIGDRFYKSLRMFLRTKMNHLSYLPVSLIHLNLCYRTSEPVCMNNDIRPSLLNHQAKIKMMQLFPAVFVEHTRIKVDEGDEHLAVRQVSRLCSEKKRSFSSLSFRIAAEQRPSQYNAECNSNHHHLSPSCRRKYICLLKGLFSKALNEENALKFSFRPFI